jgi:hypothetical protein
MMNHDKKKELYDELRKFEKSDSGKDEFAQGKRIVELAHDKFTLQKQTKDLTRLNNELQAQNDILVSALEFYADISEADYPFSVGGKTAREALKQISEMEQSK